MQSYEDHIPDQEILLAADGEVSPQRAAQIQSHLARCWSCRSRKAELEQTIAVFVQGHHQQLRHQVPPIEGPRALLRARLAEAAAQQQEQHRVAWAGAALVLVALISSFLVLPSRQASHRASEEFEPNTVWTPGAVQLVSREVVCSANEDMEEHRITASTAREVFIHYGIHEPRPRSYEVDYLIPPDLGGSEDLHNLWPQPYSTGMWNSRVKDALEDRLRSLVCEGKLDLATAQRDLAHDWIAAYKKYFQTDKPLLSHANFVKDQPWE